MASPFPEFQPSIPPKFLQLLLFLMTSSMLKTELCLSRLSGLWCSLLPCCIDNRVALGHSFPIREPIFCRASCPNLPAESLDLGRSSGCLGRRTPPFLFSADEVDMDHQAGEVGAPPGCVILCNFFPVEFIVANCLRLDMRYIVLFSFSILLKPQFPFSD